MPPSSRREGEQQPDRAPTAALRPGLTHTVSEANKEENKKEAKLLSEGHVFLAEGMVLLAPTVGRVPEVFKEL